MIFTITDALRDTKKSFYIKNNDYSQLQWNDSSPKPTLEELETKRDKMQKDWDSKQYQRDRKAEYPDWSIQLEKIYDDGIEKWKSEMVDPIKKKYPKPS